MSLDAAILFAKYSQAVPSGALAFLMKVPLMAKK